MPSARGQNILVAVFLNESLEARHGVLDGLIGHAVRESEITRTSEARARNDQDILLQLGGF